MQQQKEEENKTNKAERLVNEPRTRNILIISRHNYNKNKKYIVYKINKLYKYFRLLLLLLLK